MCWGSVYVCWEFVEVRFPFCGTGVWTQDFVFAKQELYDLNH
jgi:polyferredoxin